MPMISFRVFTMHTITMTITEWPSTSSAATTARLNRMLGRVWFLMTEAILSVRIARKNSTPTVGMMRSSSPEMISSAIPASIRQPAMISRMKSILDFFRIMKARMNL